MDSISISPISKELINFVESIPSEDWVYILNTIRRGRYYNRQSDLDYANTLLLPYLVDYGIWDGEEGKPIDRDVCVELWRYIQKITAQKEKSDA